MALTGDQLRAEARQVMQIAAWLNDAIAAQDITRARTPAKLADGIAEIQCAADRAYAETTAIVAERS